MPNNTESKIYLIILFVLMSLFMGILIQTSIDIQPLSGDLTRLGGYAERDFGWNIPRNVLSDDFKLYTTYDRYYDIVVIGDSFSKSGMWQAYLADKYRLSFTTLHWDDTTIEDVINSKQFINNPPKIFIAELGLRTLPKHLTSENPRCEQASSSVSYPGFNLLKSPKGYNPFVQISRSTASDWSEINLKFALLYLENSLLRQLFNNDFTKVKKYKLTRSDFFSNKQSNEILVLNSWFDSKKWSENEINNSICHATDLQNKIQSNGKTLFIFLPIPDKGTAYSKYIINPEFTNIQDINDKLAVSKINTPRLDILLQKAIDDGEKDVYLPNDTHYGSKGYQITAESVYHLLIKKGIIDTTTIN